MTAIDADELRKLLAEATPGPWHSEEKPAGPEANGIKASIGIWSEFLFRQAIEIADEEIDAEDEKWVAGIWGVISDNDVANARLIAAAPDLAAEVLRLRAEVEKLRAALAFYADVSDYVAPYTGGAGKLWMDCGETARAALKGGAA